MRLGYIDYLNCYPFYYDMFEKQPVENVRITPGHPSELNRMIQNGSLDMSPVSSASCPAMMDDVRLSGDFCLSSVGYVRSVILASKIPIEDLHKKKVGLSSASHTSAVLLKVLLKKYYAIQPDYVKSSPELNLKRADAQLVIGNEALKKFAHPPPYIYDLGDLWLRKTSYPVVFAVFALNKKWGAAHKEEVRLVKDSFNRSLARLEHEKKDLVAGAKKKYPDIAFDISMYYDLLRFEFTDELKKGLHFYYLSAAEAGFLDPVRHVSFF